LKHAVILLCPDERTALEQTCCRHCDHRGWRLWDVNARTTHVHVIVSAAGGRTICDQLKAICTGRLREQWPEFRDRPVWTYGGDWK
jgi:hypothetical protein